MKKIFEDRYYIPQISFSYFFALKMTTKKIQNKSHYRSNVPSDIV